LEKPERKSRDKILSSPIDVDNDTPNISIGYQKR
jgi:hypothetical protein